MRKEILKVNKLCQTFVLGRRILGGGTTIKAVNNVSLSVYEGETLGLVGESGCGKSTLGYTIIRLIRPTSGNIFFKGKDISNLSFKKMRPLRRYIQLVFQDPLESLNQRHAISTILEEPFIIHKIGNNNQRMQWVRELLDKVELPYNLINRYPHELSGGQRQRVGIARAIALKPNLLICDESVSALDVSIQAQILNLLKKLKLEMNLSMLFISHDLSVIREISDRVAVMQSGKIVEQGNTEEIYNNPQNKYTKELLSAIPISHPRDRAL